MNKTLAIVLLFGIITVILSQIKDTNQYKSGLIYGPNHSYFLDAPDGWVLDNVNGKAQGLHAVFYPKDNNWQNSPGVIYTKAIGKDSIYPNIKEYIAKDLEMFKRESPNIVARFKSDVKLENNKTAKIYDWIGDKWGNYESTAYIDENKVIVIIVYTCRDIKFYKTNYDKFINVIKSYSFFTENVNHK
jgi:hypothetical protein